VLFIDKVIAISLVNLVHNLLINNFAFQCASNIFIGVPIRIFLTLFFIVVVGFVLLMRIFLEFPGVEGVEDQIIIKVLIGIFFRGRSVVIKEFGEQID
jgi:hypothetical protein